MPPQYIIVIGAPAGGGEALQTVVSGFLPDLPAAVFEVLHIGDKRSSLPEILSKLGRLPAVHPRRGASIINSKIYVDWPDCHLIVDRLNVII